MFEGESADSCQPRGRRRSGFFDGAPCVLVAEGAVSAYSREHHHRHPALSAPRNYSYGHPHHDDIHCNLIIVSSGRQWNYSRSFQTHFPLGRRREPCSMPRTAMKSLPAPTAAPALWTNSGAADALIGLLDYGMATTPTTPSSCCYRYHSFELPVLASPTTAQCPPWSRLAASNCRLPTQLLRSTSACRTWGSIPCLCRISTCRIIRVLFLEALAPHLVFALPSQLPLSSTSKHLLRHVPRRHSEARAALYNHGNDCV